MTPKEFGLEQIKEYVLDPSRCGYEDKCCKNITYDGKMCVAGKNYLPEVIEQFPERSFSWISEYYKHDQPKFMIPSSVGILTTKEWTWLQSLHDKLSRNEAEDENFFKNENSLFTYEEMMALKA